MKTIDLDEYGRGYPRPQMVRPEWTSLNGRWDFSLDPDQRCHGPADVRWDRTITVPFSPETVASGIEDPAFFRSCWYRRRVPTPPVPERGHLLLHFGAVDYEATVWIDGRLGGAIVAAIRPSRSTSRRRAGSTISQRLPVISGWRVRTCPARWTRGAFTRATRTMS